MDDRNKDVIVQTRLDGRYLATITEWETQKGINFPSMSGLMRHIVIEYVKGILDQGARAIETSFEAAEILEKYIPTDRNPSKKGKTGFFDNLRRESLIQFEAEKEKLTITSASQEDMERIAREQLAKIFAKEEKDNELKNYDYEEGELDNIRGKEQRELTEDEKEELKQFALDMEEMKKRNLDPRRKKKEEIEENNLITERLAKQQQSLMRRRLLK